MRSSADGTAMKASSRNSSNDSATTVGTHLSEIAARMKHSDGAQKVTHTQEEPAR